MMDMGKAEACGKQQSSSWGSTQYGVNSWQRGCTHGDNGLLGLQHVRDDAISDDEEDMIL